MLPVRCPTCGQVLPDSHRWWYVHKAAADGNEDYIRNAVSEGVDVEVADPNTGDTLLSMAAFWGRENMVKLLHSLGAHVNAQNHDGYTPLFWAISRNHRAVVSVLLANGADITHTTETGLSPLHCAAMYGDLSVLELGPMDLLIGAGADINARDTLGETPLHHAVRQLYEPRAKYLLHQGADVAARNKNGDTPLDAARKYGSMKMVKLLHHYGAV